MCLLCVFMWLHVFVVSNFQTSSLWAILPDWWDKLSHYQRTQPTLRSFRLVSAGKTRQQSKLTYFLWCFEVQSSRKDYVARTETDSPLSLVQAHLLNTWPYFLLQSCPRYHKLNSFWSKNLSILQVHVRNQLILTVATPESVSWWHDKSKARCSSLRSKFGESCWCSAILIELSRMLRKVHADTVSGWTFTLEPIS